MILIFPDVSDDMLTTHPQTDSIRRIFDDFGQEGNTVYLKLRYQILGPDKMSYHNFMFAYYAPGSGIKVKKGIVDNCTFSQNEMQILEKVANIIKKQKDFDLKSFERSISEQQEFVDERQRANTLFNPYYVSI